MSDPPVTGSDDNTGRVLVVDDEPHLAEMFAAMLEERYRVTAVTSGKDAIDALTSETDVVLLDRRMPANTGDETLAEIREQGYDCQVAMVTAIRPDVDILEMEFDAYVVKPVTRKQLLDVVDDLILRSEYSENVRDTFRLASKMAALESQISRGQLVEMDEFIELQQRKDALDERSQQRITRLLERGEAGNVFVDILGRHN